MATQNYFILTVAQSVVAMGFNNDEVGVNPRVIDSASPGSGINTNQDAVGFVVGAPITLIGMRVVPVRVVNDPDYISLASDMVAFLLNLPASILENETIFLPQVD